MCNASTWRISWGRSIRLKVENVSLLREKKERRKGRKKERKKEKKKRRCADATELLHSDRSIKGTGSRLFARGISRGEGRALKLEGGEESCYDNVVTGTLDRISFTATAVSRYLTGWYVKHRSSWPCRFIVSRRLAGMALEKRRKKEQRDEQLAINQNNDCACCQNAFKIQFVRIDLQWGSFRFQTKRRRLCRCKLLRSFKLRSLFVEQ